MAGGEAMTTGKLHIVGVGPGDPELLTLKAARLIESADVTAYPETENGRRRARDIVADHLGRAHQIERPFRLPMASDPAPAQAAYDRASALITADLDAGRNVVLLCEGDPFLYGSAIHVHARLAGRYDVAVVPGVTSVTACAAEIGLALASRMDVFSIIPATLDGGALEDRLAACDAAAIIKVGRHFEKIAGILKRNGLADRAMLIAAPADDAPRALPLSELGETLPPYFSTILVSRKGAPLQ